MAYIKLIEIRHITKLWREIVDPAGATISQVKRYVSSSTIHIKEANQ